LSRKEGRKSRVIILTNSHPAGGADGALAAPLERDSEPERHLGRNLREEGPEVPLHGGGVRDARRR
jgi:hypothetical protein